MSVRSCNRASKISLSSARNRLYSTDHRNRFLWELGPKLQMKSMVIPVGRSLVVFSGSQAKNISYSTDHRRKIFRTLPKRYFGLYLLVGGRKPYRLPITLASSLSERS